MGPYSVVKRCLYGKELNEYAFEYGRQFWDKYEDMDKVLYLDFIDGHEGTGEALKHLDANLAKFL